MQYTRSFDIRPKVIDEQPCRYSYIDLQLSSMISEMCPDAKSRSWSELGDSNRSVDSVLYVSPGEVSHITNVYESDSGSWHIDIVSNSNERVSELTAHLQGYEGIILSDSDITHLENVRSLKEAIYGFFRTRQR